ncbi:RPT2, partial [Symbiodinium sp. KB8]
LVPHEARPNGEPARIKIDGFPGGPAAFEQIAKWCYGIDIDLTVDNIAFAYCAARTLRVPELEKSTEVFMTQVVLKDIVRSTAVLRAATSIQHMSDEMLEGLIGHSINAIASMFEHIPELNTLPTDAFSCIVRTARDLGTDKKALEASVVAFCEAKISEGPGKLAVDEFVEVVAAAGRIDDMGHCEAVYRLLEVMMQHHTSDAEAEVMCKALHELGFWVCLPHSVIERAYSDRNVPDRYITVALMAENRHLLQVNEQLYEKVEQLTDLLHAEGGGGGGAMVPAGGSGGGRGRPALTAGAPTPASTAPSQYYAPPTSTAGAAAYTPGPSTAGAGAGGAATTPYRAASGGYGGPGRAQ